MAQLKLNKLNMIDAAAVIAVMLLVAFGAIYYLRQPTVENTKLKVTVEVTDVAQVAAISGVAVSAKSVYLNSIDRPVNATAAMQGQALLIKLVGPGHMDEGGYYYFLGQRILVGQKAEIHGSYFAQGKVTSIENAK